ncbi:hypothetical protein TTHERM_00688270 (macronuclear) [Tetrahymena thermophila SB210]|uniref:Uncharacterized protein n=1 Tax=Tetrahymena thermophila (strain SB210) TaxID=312017 RepID=I7LXW9_TETTS|nr:hypothetical protein TTHERM_00688270 [Tetrahymena thermophila SB210]EAS06687.1 hypothetical protein TTHERM_00688270 [Tetrahymena thermophila SB210]|eukprot:XP_001026929.1 hypothetical protein TTHERM_00688270 [Tetrahymena thermophila SB210]
MNKIKNAQQTHQQELPKQFKESKVAKDDKKFQKFIKWVKKNRRKAERFNDKIKKQQILMENQNYSFELLNKKAQLQHQQQDQAKVDKINNFNLLSPAQRSRKNSAYQDINSIKQLHLLQPDQIRKESQLIQSPQLKDQNQKKISQENLVLENDVALQQKTSSSNNQNELLQKKKEKDYNDFKLQIRREMMVDDSIGGKLSYKLMLKMEQFFERHQLKNPKEKEKIINHLHYEKDASTLQKPIIEQEGAYKDDKDFIRRDSYWANLFQAENNNYALRAPDQFQYVNENDLYFPLNQQKIDIYISETIQDKINKINSFRFQDKINKSKQIIQNREQIRKQLQKEKEQKELEQKQEEELMLDIMKKQQLKKEQQQLFDQQIEEQQNPKQQIHLSQAYSINEGKNTKELYSINLLNTTATQETRNSQTINSQSNFLDAHQSKRNYTLGIDNIEFEKICNFEELKQKKSAINKLYEKLFPQQNQQIQNEKNNKSKFFKVEETQKNSIQNIFQRNSITNSPQGTQSKQQSYSQIHKIPQQKGSLLLDQQSQLFQKEQNNQIVNQDLMKSNSFSRRSTIQLKKEKEKKQQLEAPAKLQKQYQTYFQLNNIPYMSELGLEHQNQLKYYANILEDYCPNPFEKISDLNDIINYYEEQNNPEIIKNQIYSKVKKPTKPRFELKKYDEIEFLQKKVNFQYRERNKTDQLNIVDQNQNQILSHNLDKRIKSFSTKFINRPQTAFYKERKENLTKENKQEFEKVSDLSKNLSKIKTSDNKTAKTQIRRMQKFSNKQFLYTPQEHKQIQYIFPPYPLKQKEENNKTTSMIFRSAKQIKLNSSQRIHSALAQVKKSNDVV